MKLDRVLDLYNDYVISGFGLTTATGLSELLDGSNESRPGAPSVVWGKSDIKDVVEGSQASYQRDRKAGGVERRRSGTDDNR